MGKVARDRDSLTRAVMKIGRHGQGGKYPPLPLLRIGLRLSSYSVLEKYLRRAASFGVLRERRRRRVVQAVIEPSKGELRRRSTGVHNYNDRKAEVNPNRDYLDKVKQKG